MKTRLLVALFVLLPHLGCDELKQFFGEVVVSVQNSATLGGQPVNGITIIANGKTEFTLNNGEKKTFTISNRDVGSIRVVAKHSSFSSDLTFTIATPGNEGGSAALLLSTEMFLGSERVVMTCPGCESILGLQGSPVESGGINPLK